MRRTLCERQHIKTQQHHLISLLAEALRPTWGCAGGAGCRSTALTLMALRGSMPFVCGCWALASGAACLAGCKPATACTRARRGTVCDAAEPALETWGPSMMRVAAALDKHAAQAGMHATPVPGGALSSRAWLRATAPQAPRAEPDLLIWMHLAGRRWSWIWIHLIWCYLRGLRWPGWAALWLQSAQEVQQPASEAGGAARGWPALWGLWVHSVGLCTALGRLVAASWAPIVRQALIPHLCRLRGSDASGGALLSLLAAKALLEAVAAAGMPLVEGWAGRHISSMRGRTVQHQQRVRPWTVHIPCHRPGCTCRRDQPFSDSLCEERAAHLG